MEWLQDNDWLWVLFVFAVFAMHLFGHGGHGHGGHHGRRHDGDARTHRHERPGDTGPAPTARGSSASDSEVEPWQPG